MKDSQFNVFFSRICNILYEALLGLGVHLLGLHVDVHLGEVWIVREVVGVECVCAVLCCLNHGCAVLIPFYSMWLL